MDNIRANSNKIISSMYQCLKIGFFLQHNCLVPALPEVENLFVKQLLFKGMHCFKKKRFDHNYTNNSSFVDTVSNWPTVAPHALKI